VGLIADIRNMILERNMMSNHHSLLCREVKVFPIPSIGLSELFILAGTAGLAMLIVAVIAVTVVRRRKRDDTRPWKWIAIFGLTLIMLPLLVVVLGGLLVTPVSVERSYVPTPQVVVVPAEPTAAPELISTASGAPLAGTPAADISPPNPTLARDTSPPTWALVPDSTLGALAIPPIIAGLVLLVCAAIVARIPFIHVVLRRQSGDREKDREAQLRYVFLALAFWIALSVFLILDILGSASLYFRFVAIYTAFWVLVGALLLYGRPMREILLILGLFVMVPFSIRFIDWNSRKPFLRDFYRIREGMTPAQVEQIMGDYMKGGGAPLGSPKTESNERGEIVTGTLTYRHTDEGWGDSDWGVVTFENGRVVQTEFLPD
jgi:hypothetical protein